MKSNKGVTLASLVIYIIVLLIILGVLSFVSINFTSQISEVTNRGKVSNESLKLYAYLISDLKSANKVNEFADDYVRFDNDVKYTIKYLGTLSSKEREVKQYEIYRNNVLISENILDAKFDYDDKDNLFTVNVTYVFDSMLVKKSQTFLVGREY